MSFIGMDILDGGEIGFLADTRAWDWNSIYTRLKVQQVAHGVIFGQAGIVNLAEWDWYRRILRNKSAFEDLGGIVAIIQENLNQERSNAYKTRSTTERPYQFYVFGLCNGTDSLIYYANNSEFGMKQEPFVMIGEVYPQVVKQFKVHKQEKVPTMERLNRAYYLTKRLLEEDGKSPIDGKFAGRLDKNWGVLMQTL